jgi:hypothetical protein
MTFRRWLVETQLEARTSIGDFASEVRSDPSAGEMPNDRESWLSHLGWPGDDMLIAFNAAWAAYKRAMKKLPHVVA